MKRAISLTARVHLQREALRGMRADNEDEITGATLAAVAAAMHRLR